ncbi:MAG: DUF1315 family protein [Gammaproteobacteria bacterium]|nr:DUF1315 family protein [Gammaproteobacteria bacterium]
MESIDRQLFSKPPASLEDLLEQISPTIYNKLRTAIELRKWEDGSSLNQEQLENCMQLLILYEARELPESERTGRKIEKCDDRAVPISIGLSVKEEQS